MKHIIYYLVFILLFAVIASPVDAQNQENIAGSSGILEIHTIRDDWRITRLENVFSKYNPQLIPSADDFIRYADTYTLDWKLVAAISGVESTFCRHIPSGSYNCWGWGIPTGSKSGTGFRSYTDGIETVSNGLRTKYIDKGLYTIEQIGSRYAASPTWAYKVRYFMNVIDTFDSSVSSLALAE